MVPLLKEVKMYIIEFSREILQKSETETTPPWPYKSWETKKNAKKEELPVRKTEPFYPDFDNDVFAGVV